jgi:hypothetical protein
METKLHYPSFFLFFFVNDCRAAGLLLHGMQPDWKIAAVISDFKKMLPMI